jgi:LysR family transcriptional regulator, mexEF-oprN operon transcriptional activator
VNRYDLRNTDMNLLSIFEALMFEKNLTEVAGKTLHGAAGCERCVGLVA